MKITQIHPPRIAIIYLLMALGLHYISSVKTILFHSPLLGAISLTGGFTIFLWAGWLFKKKQTAICPTETPISLVITGPYRFSRNPMYLGVVFMLLGVAFIVGTFPVYLAPLAFFLTVHLVFIPYEENVDEHVLGQEYLNYKNRVRRWL